MAIPYFVKNANKVNGKRMRTSLSTRRYVD